MSRKPRSTRSRLITALAAAVLALASLTVPAHAAGSLLRSAYRRHCEHG
ncbi:hypothetical protein [Kibdelosporangium philippinense]